MFGWLLKSVSMFLLSSLTDKALHWWIPPLAVSGTLLFYAVETFEHKEYDEAVFLLLFAVAPILARFIGAAGERR